MHASPFELLELPDGRWYVAKPATSSSPALVAGSFARLEPAPEANSLAQTPVGSYGSREEAERAIQRDARAPGDPLAPFAKWLRNG